MTEIANSAWETSSWEESNYFEPAGGPPLIRADVKRVFHGDLEGTGEAVLLCCRPDEKSAGYVSTEHIVATLAGRSGTFVVQHGASMGDDQPQTLGFVVPNSGTGGLTGLAGTCAFGHDEEGKAYFRLEYRLP
ncbi:DUF3224 domain-containing protein [Streptomyces nogalater]|uniref:DUF3224 domain-containing protein n=1 Tax=Streptomyces nogalater TaxID=38314 RepID=A0ABW0WMQ5_STRNO